MDVNDPYAFNLTEAELVVRTLNASVPDALAESELSQLAPSQYEETRLRRLGDLNLLDTPEGEGYDRITRMAALMFGTPIAAVSITDRDRQWFKSSVGCPTRQIPRLRAPCAAVTSLARPVVIDDMSSEPAFEECVLVHSGLKFYAGAPLATRDGHVLGALCVLDSEAREFSPEQMELLKDFAAMVMAQVELEHDFGRTDPLTGLPNRNQLLEDLGDFARRHPEDEGILIAVELVDPKRLGQTMGVLGASYIDDLVRGCSDTLTAALESRRGLYHAGPASLAVLLTEHKPSECERIVELIRSALSVPISCNGVPVTVEPAIGISPFQPAGSHPKEILRTAFSAAHDARAADEETRYYSAENDEANRRRLLVITRFREAIESDEQLHLVYQPRVDLHTNVCAGGEALLRWNSPQLGAVSPGEFIPLVEETVLIEAVTSWVVMRALRQLAEWRRSGLHVCVSVNVSARNLAQAEFTGFVADALRSEGVPPSALELEFTEGALMSNSGRVLEQLHGLRAMGVKLAIDDFGTGYSSFSYLQRIPADVVKIDQSFIRKLDSREADQRLVRSVIRMAADLGFRSVAEGVETAESCALLREFGCDEVQGYFISRPVPPHQFRSWCETRPDRDPGLALQRLATSAG
jgi:EAL domain-containing protein (putative c-di-GMP-specific phosphodiesterase class I)/GGDEF domain-containing protein